jgi:hypothetical protein
MIAIAAMLSSCVTTTTPDGVTTTTPDGPSMGFVGGLITQTFAYLAGQSAPVATPVTPSK